MILFVPAYDEPTRSNLAVAKRLPEQQGEVRLLGDDASARLLRSAIVATAGDAQRPLYVMSHGTRDAIRAQGGGAALEAADGLHLLLLARRAVFAFACHTATVLGRVAATHGVVWWGYTGAIQSPVSEEPLAGLFAEIFRFLRDSFAGAASREARSQALEELRRRCREAERAVDEAFEADPSLDPSEALLCLLHLWDRLRIWLPGHDVPEHHPNARPPALM